MSWLYLSLLIGFCVSQLADILITSFSYGHLLGKVKFNLANRVAKNQGEDTFDWFKQSVETAMNGDAAEQLPFIYAQLSLHSKLLKLTDCVYCLTANLSVWASLITCGIGYYTTQNSYWFFSLIIIPSIAWFIRDTLNSLNK